MALLVFTLVAAFATNHRSGSIAKFKCLCADFISTKKLDATVAEKVHCIVDFGLENCAKNGKMCFKMPENCTSLSDCDGVVTIVASADKKTVRIQLGGKSQSTTDLRYIALGFSKNKMMADTSVVTCGGAGSKKGPIIGLFYNTPLVPPTGYPYPMYLTPQPNDVVSNTTNTLLNGMVSCEFDYKVETNDPTKRFDLSAQEHYLILAEGPMINETTLSYHKTNRMVSSESYQIVQSTVRSFDLSSCGKNDKICFQMPLNCTSTMNCDAVVTLTPATDKKTIRVQLGGMSTDNHYIAVGFSKDTAMGDTSVVTCGNSDSTTPDVALFYNTDEKIPKSYPVYLTPQPTDVITNSMKSFVDGVMTCEFDHKVGTSDSKKLFDLSAQQYYLLLATGSMFNSSTLEYHSNRAFSNQSYTIVAGADSGCGQMKMLNFGLIAGIFVILTQLRA